MGLFYKVNRLFEKKKPEQEKAENKSDSNCDESKYSCSKCKKEVSETDKVCPSCNTELIDENMVIDGSDKSQKKNPGFFSGCGGFLVTYMIIFFIMTAGSHEQSINEHTREFLPVLVVIKNVDNTYTIKEMKISESEKMKSENIEISYLVPEKNIKNSQIKSSFKVKRISEEKQEIKITATRLHDGQQKIKYTHCYVATSDNVESKSYALLNLPGSLQALSLVICFVLNIVLWIFIIAFRFIRSKY